MGWLLLLFLISVLALLILVISARRAELRRMSQRITDLADARQTGSHRARLQYPHVDLSRCLGCGSCVRACPEEGVLGLIHGQAVVIHGARCVGHGLCAAACPVDAIDLTLGDLQDRRDIPALVDKFEAKNVTGLFLAGEVTGYALIRTAIMHGTAVADEVADRLVLRTDKSPGHRGPSSSSANGSELFDLCIVGAGPAGLAASLQAKARRLHFVTLEQEGLGGTVSKYPRRKLVMTQPVALPLHGKLKRTTYNKEELMELWGDLARRYELPIRSGEELTGVEPGADGTFVVKTRNGHVRARFVCLALGRRGTPRRLNVPGEHLSKVAYSLIDAQSYQGRRVLVIGGGDSAIEAALGLAEQPDNQVTLSYRKSAFFRLKARNEKRLTASVASGALTCLLDSHVCEITPSDVRLQIRRPADPVVEQMLGNDEVFILAGGIPPFELLEQCGISFDPADREAAAPLADRGTGLLNALFTALLLSIALLAWVLAFHHYYWAAREVRPLSDLHDWLRPSSRFGLACGLLATLLILANLCYLLRRNWMRWLPGPLSAWMTSHVVTGMLSLLLILLHAAMSPQHTLGGHAFAALGFLVLTGAMGRYFYSFVPRATNGKELLLDELSSRIANESTDWDRLGRGFGEQVRQDITHLVATGKWNGGFFVRIAALLRTQREAKRIQYRLRQRGREQGLSSDQIDRLLTLAQQAYRTSLASAHYEDLRALLNSWRFFHRWVALLLVLLAILHIYVALRYGSSLS